MWFIHYKKMKDFHVVAILMSVCIAAVLLFTVLLCLYLHRCRCKARRQCLLEKGETLREIPTLRLNAACKNIYTNKEATPVPSVPSVPSVSEIMEEEVRVVVSCRQYKIACVYAYFEKNVQYKRNLEYFLEHGVLDAVNYYIIVNGACTVALPARTNLTVFHRENTGFDFGAYGAILAARNFSDYDFVFFLNTSVCGPYFLVAADGAVRDWTRPFLDMFEEDASVKLVGTSINVLMQSIPFLLPKDAAKPLHPHVQSMFFAVDREALAFLCGLDFFIAAQHMNFLEVVAQLEVGMSYLILENGWNINCLLPGYRGLDYRTLTHQPNPATGRTGGDPYYPGAYFGKTILPSDVIFYKNTRMATPTSK